jgi:hypothetical protein
MLPADPHAVDPSASSRNRANDRSDDNRPAHDDGAVWAGAAGPDDTTGTYDGIGFFGSKGNGYRQNTQHKNHVSHWIDPFSNGSHAPNVQQSSIRPDKY